MTKAKERVFWTTLLLLGAVSAAQGYLMASARRAPRPAPDLQAFFGGDDPFDGLRLLDEPGLEAKLTETDDAVIVAFKAPDDKGSVRVKVDGRLIRAEYERAEEGLQSRAERVMTVPPEADPATAKLEHAKGEVRVVFAKRVEGPRA